MRDAEIYEANRADLVRYTAVLVGPHDAEDVVSTVMLRVLERRRLDDLEDARAYLFRAVLNECRSRVTRARAALGSADVSVPPPTDPQPEVLAAVMGLPVRQRAATYLVYWSDQSVAETARLMATRPGTVKRYLHPARRKLKGVLDGD
ncbi:MAG: RNA polymerase sigma factor [Acidimicrobiia bacterium]